MSIPGPRWTCLLFTLALAALPLPARGAEKVFTAEHKIRLPGGGFVAATETWTEAGAARSPRRAVILLNGSAFNRQHWAIPAKGYNGTTILARAGWFTFAVDFLGVGDSSKPADGTDADFDTQTEAMSAVVDYVRGLRGVPRVDLIGEGYGGGIAVRLAANPRKVRSTVTAAMLYDSPPVAGPLTDPAFIGILESSPDGYFFIPGAGSTIFMAGAPQAAIDYVTATQGGSYPTPNFLAATDLPFFDATRARAPGLVIFGRQDFIVGPHGVDGLVREYGPRGAVLAVRDDAGHAPRIERPEIARWFWDRTLAFLERPRHP
ncbi:MAG TPA: alpha/beta fold hydrolase [Thermoanaerobaculia bacterium]|nr:alpha/beta fold hydrolase [Thermoanaerobaculia bacterium]